MPEVNPRLDTFYKCNYHNLKDGWEVKRTSNGFSVHYMCDHPSVNGTCIEMEKPSKNCPYKELRDSNVIRR